MASIIPGYEYDIFVSYRQKDKKGDRWMSEFVDKNMPGMRLSIADSVHPHFPEELER
jgi:hypothetical protein